jgi:tetratricopeptide (TPR) repeat protein
LTKAVERGLRDAWPGLSVILFSRESPLVQRRAREHEFLLGMMQAGLSELEADLAGEVLGADLTVLGTLEMIAESPEGPASARLTLRLSAPTRRDAAHNYEATAPVAAGDDVDGWARMVASLVVADIARDGPVLLQGKPAGPEEHFRRGQQLAGQGQHAEAIVEYRYALAGDPRNPAIYSALGEEYGAAGDRERALQHFKRALELAPESAAARLGLARLYQQIGDSDAAQRELRRILDSDPADIEARCVLATVMLERGYFADAAAQYERLLETKADDTDALSNLAGIYERLSLWEKARQTYDRLLEAAPENRDALQRLIQVCVRTGQLPEAVAYLRKAFDGLSGRAQYAPAQYAALIRVLDLEAEAVLKEAAGWFRDYRGGAITRERTEGALSRLHARSDNLARVADKLEAPGRLSLALPHRVLAYYLLNQSDYEFLRYLETGEGWRYDRARLLRDACRTALQRSRALEAAAGWPTLTEAER